MPILTIADSDGTAVGQRQQTGQVGEVELTIGVGEGDALEGGGLEARAESGAVASIIAVPQEPNVGTRRGQLLDDGGGAVLAAVVHNQDFVVRHKSAEGVVGFLDRTANTRFFVVSRQHEREAVR